ncbi:DUF5689 domain-containing protein [Aquimarina longa]|uniref:DUF5689 domain-containing protein n=1 Tax=Aquimarina longa TaxID=1080221 RepID=UPI000783474F|nr:DUF5689 domain-containing protein [Aquimarina longa]
MNTKKDSIKMNLIHIKKFFSILIVVQILTACVQEDFKTPELAIEEPDIEGTMVTIDALLGILGQEVVKEGENAKVVFKDTDNFIEGYVVSNDKASNFFKEVILQDKNVNPSAGVRVLIDDNPLFTTYEFGRKVYIKLDGLSIGIENGVPTLGISEGNDIAAIPSFYIDKVLIRSTEIVRITPLEVVLEDFTDKLLNLYVKINNLQFSKNLIQEENVFTFAAETNDKFDGERIIESCATGRTTIVSTSTFSDFKGLKLPVTQGSFEGILTKNFLGNRYNLVLNDSRGLVFDTDIRCDPLVLECKIIAGDTKELFREDFTGIKTKDLHDKGWINKNTTGGKLTYKIGDFANNQYMQITGFRSKESLYEVWLITPEIDLSMSTDEALHFDLQAGYDNGNIMEVFITNEFTKDPTTTSWVKLDATIPRGPLNGFGNSIPSGPIGVSCIDGTVRIGFRYIGGDPRATTRYHIDAIKIIGKE